MYLNRQKQVESMRKSFLMESFYKKTLGCLILAFLLLLPLAKADVFFTNQNPPNLAQRDDLHPFLNASIQPYSNVSTSLNCSLYVDNVLNQTVNDIANNTVVYLNSSTLSQGDHSWYINCTDNNWATQAQSEVRTIGIGSNFGRCAVLVDEYGSYKLTTSLIDVLTTPCINIPNNNIVFDCQDYTLDSVGGNYYYGIYVYRSSSTITNITIKNCIVTQWGGDNIHFENADNNTIENITTNRAVNIGLHLLSSSNNTIANLNSDSNGLRSIQLDNSDNNELINITTSNNQYQGVVIFSGSNNNTIINLTSFGNNDGINILDSYNEIRNSNLSNNKRYGVYILANSNIVKDSIISNNPTGIYFSSYSNNIIYNNLLNNTNNFYIPAGYTNYWNTTRQTGTRIYSPGTEIGGNYWTNPDGNGYSDTCTDADKDGFCDNPYVLATNNIDYLALSDEYSPPTTTTLPPVHGVPLLSSTLVGVVIGFGILTFMLRTLFDIREPKKVIEYFIVLAVIVLTVISLIALFA
jgi:regulator of extracellular matrix RemA (YlzA/DUF370 family)